jgi:ATP synthase protein I
MANESDPLHDLGKRLDDLAAKQADLTKSPPRNQWGLAFHFAADLLAGLVVGGGMGWGIDWLFGHFGIRTSPAFMIGFFVLGAAAGIRNVIRTAQDINAENSAREEK